MILDPPLDVAHCSRRSLRQHSVLHAHARARIEQKRELRIRSRHGRYSSYPHSRAAVHTHAAATFDAFEAYILRLQKNIIQEAEIIDGGSQCFKNDRWQRGSAEMNAGYGITSVLEGGDLLEKAAANITVVRGELSEVRAASMSSRGRIMSAGTPYAAAAMSLVFHPAHPFVPTLRADVRLFQAGDQAWFGGGCDLTPSYLFDDDAVSFHTFWRDLCDRHGRQLYNDYKAWCDRYFYLPARKEHRGIGGIFFDDLAVDNSDVDAPQFVEDVGQNIISSWRGIAETRRQLPFTHEQRQWQLLRRGRYLEFNLLYDRGVRFGLDGGRVESIMVSAPPLVAWQYCADPLPNSEEARLVAALRQPIQWSPSPLTPSSS